MLVDRGGERTPLAGASEWAAPPATLAGPGQIACLIGPEPRQTIALVTIDTQRITRQIPIEGQLSGLQIQGHPVIISSTSRSRRLVCGGSSSRERPCTA